MEDEYEKTIEECEDLECRDHAVILYKGLSNQRTNWSGRRRSGEYGSCDNHLEWPPKIMGFIHSRNVCQKEVITFNGIWEECTQEEARLILRREDGRNWRSTTHDSKKIPQAMRNMKDSILEEPLIHLSIWIRNDVVMNEEDDEAEGSRRSLATK